MSSELKIGDIMYLQIEFLHQLKTYKQFLEQ